MAGNSRSDGLIVFMQSTIIRVMVESGSTEEQARRLAEEIAERMADQWGGEKHYVSRPNKRVRDRQIVIDVLERKMARDQVAKRHGVTRRTVDRAVCRHLSASSGGFGSRDWNL